MAAEYLLKVIHSFSAAHYLRGYAGRCARMHGHDYKIEVELACPHLNTIGLGIDYNDIKVVLFELTDILDHRCINEIPPFVEINPSAENIAAWFYRELNDKFKAIDEAISVKAVILQETEKFSVRYSE